MFGFTLALPFVVAEARVPPPDLANVVNAYKLLFIVILSLALLVLVLLRV